MKKPRKEVFAGKTIEELEALTKDLDQEFIVDSFGPPSKAERRRWESAKRKRGRPRVGKGAKVISVSFETELLNQLDRAAKRKGTTRAAYLAGAVRLQMTRDQAISQKKRTRKRAA